MQLQAQPNLLIGNGSGEVVPGLTSRLFDGNDEFLAICNPVDLQQVLNSWEFSGLWLLATHRKSPSVGQSCWVEQERWQPCPVEALQIPGCVWRLVSGRPLLPM